MSRLGLLLISIIGAVVLTAALFWSARATDPSAATPAAAAAPTDAPIPSMELAEPSDALLDSGPSSGERPGAVRGDERAEVPVASEAQGQADELDFATILLTLRSQETGAAVAGARVYARSHRGRTSANAVTGPDGRADLRIAHSVSSTVSVAVDPKEHGPAYSSVPPLTPAQTFDLVLEVSTATEVLFSGRVVAEESSEPVPGASVKVRRTTHWRADSAASYSGEVLSTTTADAGGAFSVGFSPWMGGALHVLVEAPGRMLRTAQLEAVPAGAPPVEIALLQGAALLVTAVNADGGPLSAVEVRVVKSGGPALGQVYLGDHAWTAETDAAGRARLGELAPDTRLELGVRLPGVERWRRQEPVFLAAGEEHEVTLVVGAGAVIRGRVERVGQSRSSYNQVSLEPLDGTASGATSRTLWTDGLGRFEFEDVPDGDWTIGLVKTMFASRRERVSVRGGLVDREVILRAHRDLVVSGLVLGPDGEPVDAASIHAVSLEGGATASAESNSAGEFEIGPLVPGRVLLTAHSRHLSTSDEVVAEAGAEGVRLHPRPGGSIRGTVVSLGGDPVRALVSAWSDGSAGRTVNARDSGFVLAGLAPGAYELWAHASGGEAAFGYHSPVLVVAGSELEVRIDLEPGARLRIRNETEADVGFAVNRGSIVVYRGILRPGAGDLVAVPGGDLTVTFDEVDIRQARAVAGEETEMVYGEDDP